jgi:hypothetical protein
MAARTELALTVGRNGIKVPEIEIDDRIDAAWRVGQFFHNLWEANGLGEDNEYDRGERRPYLNELVVPADADKPLVVVRGQYTQTSSRQRQNDMRGNVQHNAWDDSGGFGRVDEDVVTVGVEEHSILVPPTDGTLEWSSLLSYRYSHKGGARLINSRQMNQPSISFPGRQELDEQARGQDWSNDFETQTTIFNQGVTKILEQFVELVSTSQE